jgi:hypothetical protein
LPAKFEAVDCSAFAKLKNMKIVDKNITAKTSATVLHIAEFKEGFCVFLLLTLMLS